MLLQTLLPLLKCFVKKYPFTRALFSSILFLAISFSGYGQGKNFSINKSDPSWIQKVALKQKKPADKDITDGYFLSLHENQNHIELEEDYTHRIREIVSDAGVQNGSQISITYDPGFQKLIFHKILVWRNGRSSDRLQTNAFKFLQSEKELSRFIYSGTYDALMVLDDIRKGDRIEYAYTLKGYNPIYGKKYTSTFYFEGSSSIGHIYANVILNKSRKLNFRNFNSNLPPKITDKDNLKIYEWENTLTKTHRVTDYEPNWYNPLWRTQVSEFQDWSDVVNWGLAINDYPNLKTPLLDKKVKELKAESKNVKDYIKLATRFVQDEIRYMGIEIGIYSHRPNSPEKILKQRYGDCKDKSLLLVKLLEANGITAYMTYANSYSNTNKIDYLPSPFVFNHVIVAIDYNKHRTWVDPTISYQRGNFDDFYAPNYGNVLVVKKGVNALEMIESKPTGKLTSYLDFKLADTVSGTKSTLDIYSVYKSNYADDMRADLASSGTEKMQKQFLEYYATLYPEIEIKNNLTVEDDEEANVLEIKESYEITDFWSNSDDPYNRLAYFYGDLISDELRGVKSKSRLTPIAIKHAANIEQNITIILPYSVIPSDDNFSVENDNYFFDIYHNQNDSTIKFNYTYRNMTDYIPENQIQKYINDVKKINEYLTYGINRDPAVGSTAGLSFYMIFPYLLTLAVTALIFTRLYFKRSTFDIEKISNTIPIGGWLAVIAIRMVLFPIDILSKPFTSNMFSNQLWHNLGKIGVNEVLLKSCFILEIILFAALFAYSIFCIILCFQKRVELPKHYIILTSIYIIFLIFDTSLAAYLEVVNKRAPISLDEAYRFIVSLLFSIILIWYFLKSKRVKQTFVLTYPKFEWKSALTKYYEELSFKKEVKTEEDNKNEYENF